MISLDQVYLLEQKVESAVEKIQQLQAENDALRSKCNELTNALSAKSEQLSNFESDQSQIESGIKKALDRLNSIENSVLKNAASGSQTAQTANKAQTLVQNSPAPQAESPKTSEIPETPVQSQGEPDKTPSFDTMAAVSQEQIQEPEENPEEQSVNIPEQVFGPDSSETPDETFEGEEDPDSSEDDNHDGLGFDIF